ncbi:hypothetical protein ACS0TY_003750 [Phlomoides rotata]
MCLIGKVLSNKPFNAFGLLETMRKAMNPSRGFTAKEIRKNLFLFQFRSKSDMVGVGWGGAAINYSAYHGDISGPFIRSSYGCSIGPVTQIRGLIGDVLEIDSAFMDGVARSIRIKVRVDYRRPLRRGILLELKENNQVWVDFKYERLPYFCYLCGILGHMRRECDLTEGATELDELPEEKLPFREWLRASPMKKASITTDESRK